VLRAISTAGHVKLALAASLTGVLAGGRRASVRCARQCTCVVLLDWRAC
jgi:hypothetical protein